MMVKIIRNVIRRNWIINQCAMNMPVCTDIEFRTVINLLNAVNKFNLISKFWLKRNWFLNTWQNNAMKNVNKEYDVSLYFNHKDILSICLFIMTPPTVDTWLNLYLRSCNASIMEKDLLILYIRTECCCLPFLQFLIRIVVFSWWSDKHVNSFLKLLWK